MISAVPMIFAILLFTLLLTIEEQVQVPLKRFKMR
jgi:hypothetical protein